MISSNEIANQNKLWYDILPGGHIAAFATKGTPDGPTGYIQPTIRTMIEALQDPSSKWSSLLTTCEVTGSIHRPAKDYAFSHGTKTVNISCIVVIRDNVAENTEANGDVWCNMLVRAIDTKFDVKVARTSQLNKKH